MFESLKRMRQSAAAVIASAMNKASVATQELIAQAASDGPKKTRMEKARKVVGHFNVVQIKGSKDREQRLQRTKNGLKVLNAYKIDWRSLERNKYAPWGRGVNA